MSEFDPEIRRILDHVEKTFKDVVQEIKMGIPYNRVGEQLGQVVGSQIDALAGAIYDYAKYDPCQPVREEALDAMLSLHMELVREDQ